MKKKKYKRAGQPPKYPTPISLQRGMDKFFEECSENGDMPTIMGMFLSLGFCDKKSLHDYQKRSPQFFHIVKAAKTKCFNMKMQAGFRGEIPPTLLIWDGINNHGMVNTKVKEEAQRNEHTDTVVIIERDIVKK